MKLTEHFKLGEFTRSYTAKAHNIDNSVPDIETAYKLVALCVHILEPLRNHVGHPIRISSGYRCPMLNAMVHGSKTSQHMYGEACDIAANDQSQAEEYFEYIRKNLVFDQLILECSLGGHQPSWWVHVSYSGCGNRHEIMKMEDGRTTFHVLKVGASEINYKL